MKIRCHTRLVNVGYHAHVFIKPCPEISGNRYRGDSAIPDAQTVNVHFRELLSSTYKHKLGFTIVKLKLILNHPGSNDFNTLFHSSDRIGLT